MFCKSLYADQFRIPEDTNCKLFLTMGLQHREPGHAEPRKRNLNRYWNKGEIPV